MARGKKKKDILVVVHGPAIAAEIIQREIGHLLSNLGIAHVTVCGDKFSNGSGQSHDPERLKLLLDLARQELEVNVQVADEDDA